MNRKGKIRFQDGVQRRNISEIVDSDKKLSTDKGDETDFKEATEEDSDIEEYSEMIARMKQYCFCVENKILSSEK